MACASQPLALDDYIAAIGDVDRVIKHAGRDAQRITDYTNRGFAGLQHVPPHVQAAYQRLVDTGFLNSASIRCLTIRTERRPVHIRAA